MNTPDLNVKGSKNNKHINKKTMSKLDMSIKRSTVNQKDFPFLSVLLRLEYNTSLRNLN